MINFTLDMNCIIDLEEERESASHIRDLIQWHNDGKVNLRVVAIGGSERRLDGTYPNSFEQFQEKLTKVGLNHVEILSTITVWGMGFWGQFLWADDESEELERQIHEILFPQIELNYGDFCSNRGIEPNNGDADPRWRNPKCDVLTMWGHIHHAGHIFVTRDGNFLGTKKQALIALGAGDILSPKEAVDRLISPSGC